MSLSLCMIVKDEENNLPRCLDSVKDIVDEMIIADTGSSDSTVKIAESYGAKVYHFPWNGNFSDARNFSLKFASGDWIMIMDADDQLEESGKQGVLDLIKSGDADAYFFETISYIGDKPGFDTIKNMNLRLMKNGKGYFYSNPIHEQIYCNIKAVNPSAKIVNKDIKVYHYGYLNKNIIEHKKRARNIALLEKELENKPGYPFALFNLGSEYYAMGDNIKAIDYFEQVYRNFNPLEGFSSHLLLKMVNCYISLGRYEDALKVSDEGLLHYPGFTDLEYMKGTVQNASGKYIQAIEHFKKCCEMGEAPNYLNVLIGAGTFRPCYFLGDIYFNFEDYSSSVKYYKNCFMHNPGFADVLSKYVKACCRDKSGRLELIKRIEELRKNASENFDLTVFQALMEEKHYDKALSYIENLEKSSGTSALSCYHKGLCKLYLKKYKSSTHFMGIAKKDPEYTTKAVLIQVMCKIIEGKYAQAQKLLHSPGLNQEDAGVKVYKAFISIMETGKTTVLSDEEQESARYTPHIFGILRTLIINYEFNIFEKALHLLNTITDKTVLLKLAKLYYAENCFELAHQELLRSIKIFDYIDPEGAGILCKLKYRGL